MSKKKKNILFYILVGLIIGMGFLMRYISSKIDFKRKYGMPKDEFVNTVGRMGVKDFKDSMNNYLGRKIEPGDSQEVPQLDWVKKIAQKAGLSIVQGGIGIQIDVSTDVKMYNALISKSGYSGQLQKDIDWMLLQDGADSIEKPNLISAMNVKLLENFGLTLNDPATKKEMKKAMNTFLKRNQ